MTPPCRGCFDAVVHRNGVIVAIAEVKSKRNPSASRKRFGRTKQCAKYKQAGLPVFLVVNMDGIAGAIRGIRKLLCPGKNGSGEDSKPNSS